MTDKLLKKKYGNIVEGPQGYQMPEKIAREIEAIAKAEALPKDFGYRRLAKAASEFRLESGERADVSFITTDAVDREGEVVLPKGGSWKAYNRVVTFAHRYDELPAGVNLWIKPQETKGGAGLLGKTQYPTKPADWGDAPWMPSAILHLMQQDPPTCTGKSIGFLALNIRTATKKELETHPNWDGRGIIDKWVGIEYAVAPVPCNPEAEMETVSKCLADDEHAREVILAAIKSVAPKAKEPEEEKPVELVSVDAPFTTPEVIRAYAKALVERELSTVKQSMTKEIRAAIQRAMGRI